MLALARAGGFGPAENVLFWHTGGSLALLAFADTLAARGPQ
jgi:1-aminocyclopropane-1-carboxylate deaminase/D-cysteine desulfhydrase-like pyridoxal-dependent ACC family enzyme